MNHKVKWSTVPLAGAEENQLHPELIGLASLNPWAGHNSASRQQMYTTHVTQALVIKGSTPRRCQTGMEREYGKYTFSVKVPCHKGVNEITENDGIEVLKVIERYPRSLGINSLNINPQTFVIYEDIQTKQVGVLELPTFCSHHSYFGFQYVPTAAYNEVLRPGNRLKAGTVLLDSPSVTPDGQYKYGVECNIAYMSLPGVAEDGIIIADDMLEKLTFKKYEKRTISWGSDSFPLNLYGDENTYKPFPDINDPVRPDGLLMATRSYDPILAISEQNRNNSRTPDYTFDELVYGGPGNGRVIDVKVYTNFAIKTEEVTRDDHVDLYADATFKFYKSLITEYERLKRIRAGNLNLTDDFTRLLTEAYSVTDPQVQLDYKKESTDQYRVEIVIEYDIVPTIGFKMTNSHG